MPSMTNHAAIVTGGGRGIGRTITLRLARQYPVVAVGRNQADLESVCAEVRSSGGMAVPCPGDVADPRTADAAVGVVREQGWQLRHVVCNAGIGKGGSAHELRLEDWHEVFAVNVHGSFYFVRACLPSLIEQKAGTIVLMSSTAGVKGYKNNAAYTASKHALVGLARALAQEVGKHGVVVVPVCPGFVHSDMTERTIAGLMRHRGMTRDQAIDVIAEKNPQRRILPAEEVAEAVAVVCSGLVPSLAGQPLILGGGE
jgi:NAD(P)-dependent dehydrogenase (short-subunit alcohol dehydrogenase family)